MYFKNAETTYRNKLKNNLLILFKMAYNWLILIKIVCTCIYIGYIVIVRNKP